MKNILIQTQIIFKTCVIYFIMQTIKFINSINEFSSVPKICGCFPDFPSDKMSKIQLHTVYTRHRH